MKGLFTSAAATLLILFVSTCKESGVPVSKPSTFVRYFSDGNPNTAVDFVQTSDGGFLILSYSKPKGSLYGWINLIITTGSGNTVREKKLIDKFATKDLRPSNIVATSTGYLIVGTLQDAYSGSRLFVARIDQNGDLVDSASYKSTKAGTYLIGKGVAQSDFATKDFFLVAQVVGPDLVTPDAEDMYLTRIYGPSLDSVVFTHTQGAGVSELSSRLYYRPLNLQTMDSARLFWGGTVTDAYGTHFLLVKTRFQEEPESGSVFTLPNFGTHRAGDFCTYGGGFAFVGGVVDNLSPDVYDSLSFLTAVDAGTKINSSYKRYPLKFSQKALPLNSVSAISNGYIILGTEVLDASGSANTDYSLRKVDTNGNPYPGWPKFYGGQYPDVGVRVLQSNDGGYVVLGTTTLANVETVFFMKTDAQGNIQ